MSKKKKLMVVFLVLALIVSNILVFAFVFNNKAEDEKVVLKMDIVTDTLDVLSVNYVMDDQFDPAKIGECQINEINKDITVSFETKLTNVYRFNMGHWPANIEVKRIYFEARGVEYDIPLDNLAYGMWSGAVESIELTENGYKFYVTENDPHIDFAYDTTEILDTVQKSLIKRKIIYDILLAMLIDITIICILRNMLIFEELYRNVRFDRGLIAGLSKNDFKTKFAGSYFGIIWAFVQPLITILVYWFVFQVGLRSQKMCDYPFVLWLMCGLIPWFYFSEALGSGTNSLTEYSYLVKKVVFKIDVLPIVKVLSALFVHLFFVCFIIIFFACYGYTPDIYTVQLIYCIICNIALALSLSYLTSAVVVFFKDLGQIIGIILQIGVWITPILWDANTVSKKLDIALRINPVYYIVNGFRNSLLSKEWCFEDPVWTIVFWCTVILLYITGRKVFSKLQVHFADVM